MNQSRIEAPPRPYRPDVTLLVFLSAGYGLYAEALNRHRTYGVEGQTRTSMMLRLE